MRATVDLDVRLGEMIEMAIAGHTLQEIGNNWGLTRERVRQILWGANTSTSEIRAARRRRLQLIPIACRHCGELYLPGEKRQHYAKGKHVGKMKYQDEPEWVRDRDAAIVADYDAGVKVADIVARYKIQAPRITRALKYLGRTPDRHSGVHHRARLKTQAESQIRMMAIVRDYQAEELLVPEIMAKHHVSHGMIGNALKFAGASLLSAAEAQERRSRINLKRGLKANGQPMIPGYRYQGKTIVRIRRK